MKIVINIVSAILMFWPTALFLLIKSLIHPVGFWENFAVYGGGIWVFGGLQLLFLFLGVTWLLHLNEK